MAYLISDIKKAVEKYNVGDTVIIKHSKMFEHEVRTYNEPCNIIGIYPELVLLKTTSRKNSQLVFSMKHFDFLSTVYPQYTSLKNHEKDTLDIWSCDKEFSNMNRNNLTKKLENLGIVWILVKQSFLH